MILPPEGTNITYKILGNDAVAMTGGQPVDGVITVPAIANQLRSGGVQRIAPVSDEPEKYTDRRVLSDLGETGVYQRGARPEQPDLLPPARPAGEMH